MASPKPVSASQRTGNAVARASTAAWSANSVWVNKLMAMTLELIGGSSYLWRWKHVVFHHTYVNITGHDTDIDLGILAMAGGLMIVPSFAAIQAWAMTP